MFSTLIIIVHCTLCFPVAFTTTYPATVVNSPTLTFTNVITNQGLGFNRATGTFTCPVSGLYYFTYYIYIHKTSRLDNGQFNLYKNEKPTGSFLKFNDKYDRYKSNYYDYGLSNSVVLRLVIGDIVELRYSDKKYDIDTLSMEMSMFSGMLVARGEKAIQLN